MAGTKILLVPAMIFNHTLKNLINIVYANPIIEHRVFFELWVAVCLAAFTQARFTGFLRPSKVVVFTLPTRFVFHCSPPFHA
jgi:hypothetical protein